MAKHPLHNVVIAGAYNTKQARVLEEHTAETITWDAIRGVLDNAGLSTSDLDGVSASAGMGNQPGTRGGGYLAYVMGVAPAWSSATGAGITAILEAASAIAIGECHTVVVACGQAGAFTERGSTAPWTRPSNEFIECWGLHTPVEFALIARRHMHLYGTKPEHLATVSATIRNHGHMNPEAVYYGRGPFTPEDILNSRMVADPYHLLDCSTTSEGGAAVILTTAERAKDMKQKPIYILGGARETYGQGYTFPPAFSHTGWVGRDAAKKSFQMAGGIKPEDVDVCEFYDAFSFEIIRQFEAFGFCGEGEGGDFIMGGTIGLTGKYPVCTDGGTMSHSHAGNAQLTHKVVAGIRQLKGEAGDRQVKDAKIAICTNGGAGAMGKQVMVLGKELP